jgi:hypothetical protein
VLLNVNLTNIADDRVQHFLYKANLDVIPCNKNLHYLMYFIYPKEITRGEYFEMK